ncbi:hypothetical protein ABZZ17_08755 [Streptomyces sp. NPDC006512]|uniref:type IV pili methyl-accepting chemotaxis transducer N-terminal domain-containing protein n=1 Tax=Streptomyces sp. NPDC006512 TaxID=3154307 RepID=UPI0033B07A25
MKRFPVIAALCVSALLGLSACSSDDSDSPAAEASKATQTAAELCTNLAALKADNAKLKALDPANATKDQVKSAVDAVQQDWENVKENTAALKEAERAAVQASAEDIKKSYEAMPGDTTGKDALTQLQPKIQTLDETTTAASKGLRC